MNYPFDEIKRTYEKWLPHIVATINRNERLWPLPYLMEWMRLMSPIEKQTWEALRFYGHVPMYPQFPAGPYFLDFANPIKKIAIECDGKDYHKDKDKDRRREIELTSNGWKVFRISGSDCFRIPDNKYYDYNREDSMENWRKLREWFYLQTVEGLIHAIDRKYFSGWSSELDTESYDYDDEIDRELQLIEDELTEQCIRKRLVLLS